MTPTKDELRELRKLDSELAVWMFPDRRIDYSTSGIEPEVGVERYGFFHPTTDPAAAMEVLKKCAEKERRICIWSRDGKFALSCDSVSQSDGYHELPEAIVRFARKLYERPNERD